MKNTRRVSTLNTVKDCRTELERLEAGGGVRHNESNKLIPLSAKALHIVERMFEIAGRYDPEIWSFLADEADWKTRVTSVKRAEEVFNAPMQYRIPTRSPYGAPINRGASRSDRQADRLTSRRKTVAGNGSRA